MEQHTYMIETTAGIAYLVIDEDEDIVDDLELDEKIIDQWELFKNDEAGEEFKDADLISYERIN